MKRIAYTILCCSFLLKGCQTAQFPVSKLNPANLLPDSQKETESQAEIEENSKQFLSQIKENAASDTAQVDQYIQRGQQEIVSWYQDQDDRHIRSAKDNFRNALKLRPKSNVDALHGLAVVADLEKNFQVAEQHYQLALAQSPGDSNILGNLGYSYLLQNRFDESERYLSRATQVDPGNVDAVKHLGEVYVKLGQPGRAQSVLAQVMSPDEARRMIADQTNGASVKKSESLAGALFSRDQPELQNRPQGEQVHTARVGDSSRQQLMQFHNSARGYQYPGNQDSQLSEQQLKARLASIDKERHQNLSGGPVVINSQTGQINTNFASNQQGPQLRANAPSQIPQQNMTPAARAAEYNQSSLQVNQNQYSEMSPYQQQQFAQNQRMGRHPQQQGHYAPDHTMTPAASQLQTTANANHLRQPNQNISQNINAQFSNRQSSNTQPSQINDPLRKPWGSLDQSNATQVSYEHQQTMQPYPGPQTLDNSQIQGKLIDLSQGSRQGQTSYDSNRIMSRQQNARQSFLQAASNRNSNQQAQQSASMQAAKLGMGVGPGNMFPDVNETAPSQQPGMQSSWNGGSFDQARRMLPTDVAPLDLSQASGQNPNMNSMGQQLPGSRVTNEFGQFGTASRFDSQLHSQSQQHNRYQQSQINLQNQQLQMDQQLREQRQRSQSQLNQQTQNTWNQRPLTPHTPSSGGPEILSPAEYGGMVPVNHNNESSNGVPPYPYSHRREHGEHSTQRAIQQNHNGQLPLNTGQDANQYYDSNSYQNIVEPPPYRTSMDTGNHQQRGRAIQQVGYTDLNAGQIMRTNDISSQHQINSQYRNGSNMPMIVPGGP